MPNDLTPIHGIGHNGAPPDVAASEFSPDVARFLDGWKAWEAAGLDESNAGHLSDFVSGASALHERIDVARGVLKKAYDDAAKAVQSAFAPHLDALDLIKRKAKARLGEYLEREQAEALARWEATKAELEAKLSEAQGRLALAQAEADIPAELAARQQIEACEAWLKGLGKPPKVTIASATGGGKSRGLRTQKSVTITNKRLALVALMHEPELEKALIAAGNRRVRAADYDGAPIPGLDLTIERSVT